MTSATRYLTRVSLRTDVPAAALRALLIPADDAVRTATAHRLVWTLFGDTPDRTRDFLWREAAAGVFYLLSERPPCDRHALFTMGDSRPFAPSLCVGDRLAFQLRANATVSRGGGEDGRGKRCDVVMDAIHGASGDQRASARREAIHVAGAQWLTRQGEKAGFSIVSTGPESPGNGIRERAVSVEAYRTLDVGRRGAPARLGVLDFEGVLEVTEPTIFIAGVRRGFGRAKAFGCGLMLIRRA